MLYLKTHPRTHSSEAQRAIEAVDGYLFLGLPREALAQVAQIARDEQDEAPVMLAKTRALLHLRRWRDAKLLARRGARLHPDEEEFTVQQAFALHQLEKGEEAFKVLLAAPVWILRTGILHYNLGCYEARLGDIDTARRCIDAAIELNSAMKRNARSDPDLAGL